MQRQVQQLYCNKLHNIQQKFKVISQAYTKLTLELAQKNQLIQDLNRAIQILQISLQQSNSKLQQSKANIEQLQSRLEKQTSIKRVLVGSTQNKSSSFLSSKLTTPFNSQTSIIPKLRIHKQPLELQQSKEMIRKYQSLIKSVSPNTKTIFEVEKIHKLEKKKENAQQDERSTIKKVDNAFNSQKFSDLTNLKLIKTNFQSKQKYQIAIQARQAGSSSSKAIQVVNKEATIETLTKIWQERDRQIQKMDELFQTINNKLKDFQQ